MFYCHNCNAVIDAKAVRCIRGSVLCPECRCIEHKMNELTLKLVTQNKLLSLARLTNACPQKVRMIRVAIDRINEELISLDYDFSERGGRGRFS